MFNLSDVHMVSFNVNGIRTESKRRTIFNFLKSQKANIILLQETHSKSEDEILWSNEWGNKILFSHGSNLVKGVAIMFQKHFPVNIEYVKQDLQGRYLICDLDINGYKFLLINVYGPNEDDSMFYIELFKNIDSRENTSMVLAGDFNTSLDMVMDLLNNSGNNHVKKRQVILEYMQNKDLIDVWRVRNPESRIYTWRKPFSNDVVMSRLDFFLISQDLSLQTNKTDIKAKFISDHSRITLDLDFMDNKRGKGVWKFNNLLLNDQEFVNNINTLIIQFKYEVKNRECIHPLIQWESIKDLIADYSKRYSAEKAKLRNKLVESFENRILLLDQKLINTTDVQLKIKYQRDIRKTEEFLLNEYEKRVQAACFRSKAEYFLYGERNSKYFFNLEKYRGNSKSISQLICDNGIIIKDPKKMLLEEKMYYQKLYGFLECSSWPYINNTDQCLSDEEKLVFEQEFTDTELADSLMGMSNSKTPGPDGLSADFYKIFWPQLRDLYGNAIRIAIIEEKLHESARQGLIALLLKKDRDLLFLKNWRPLTLLNVDYKILSRAVALRLKTKIHDLVHEDQTGFIAQRNISHNLRTIIDIIQIAKRDSLEMIMVSMDWEKCFDRISFVAIDNICLKIFQFWGTIL